MKKLNLFVENYKATILKLYIRGYKVGNISEWLFSEWAKGMITAAELDTLEKYNKRVHYTMNK